MKELVKLDKLCHIESFLVSILIEKLNKTIL